MKLQDYLIKHRLTLVQKIDPFDTQEAVAASLVDPAEPGDLFEVHANADRTHLVSINTTRNKFKIVHNELTCVESEWLSVTSDFFVETLLRN